MSVIVFMRGTAHVLSSAHQLVMESLPQELMDEIINSLPRSTLPSSSLVAKRWRRRSQQRAFDSISFASEDRVNRWHTDIQKDPGGISSYIERAEFCAITWDEPALFSRVLRRFCSLKQLLVYKTGIPDELPGHLSHGEFGEGITVLSLWFPHCTLSTMVSLVLSFPNLKYLAIEPQRDMSREPLLARSVVSRKEPLDLLALCGNADGVAEALVQNQFVSRCLILDIYYISGVQRLLSFSSKTVVELTLDGALFQRSADSASNNGDLHRRLCQRVPSSHRLTIISDPHFSTHRPFRRVPLASSCRCPGLHITSSSVNLHQYRLRIEGDHRTRPLGFVGWHV